MGGIRFLWTLLIALAVAGPTASAAAQPGNASGENLLDLPAMALLPADLEAAGLDDYVVGIGNLTLWDYEAAWLAQALALDEDRVVDAFDDAGADRVYKMFLDLRAEPEDPESEVVATVVSYAYVGEDEAGARALFELMADGAAETARLEVAAETVGDASSLTLHEGREPYTQREATWIALHAQAGRDVAGVVIIDYAGGTPDADVAVALGERLLGRIADVRDGESPGLAPLALQLVPDDEVAFPNAFYAQVDGEALPVGTADSGFYKYFETNPDDEARAAFYEEIGTIDVYFLTQQLRGGREGGNQDYYYEAVLLRFGDEVAAEEYVASLPDRFAADANYEDLEQLDEVPTAGDEAVAFAYRREYTDEVTHVHRPTYVRVGEVVARVDVLGIAPLDEGAEAVAEAQAECLAAGGCTELMEAPADLRAG